MDGGFWERNNLPTIGRPLVIPVDYILLFIGTLAVIVALCWPRPTIVKKVVATHTVTKTITKVVYANGLTTAQNTFIKQCEQNTHAYTDSSGTVHTDEAIPNVEVTPWTCSFAQGIGNG